MGKYSQEAAQANAKIDAAIAKLGTLQNGSTALENNLSNQSYLVLFALTHKVS